MIWGPEEEKSLEFLCIDYDREPVKLQEVDVEKIQRMLQTLEGKELDYFAYARDTPKGKTTNCTLKRARACIVQIPKLESQVDDNSTVLDALCIDLVGVRFLRKMVRILVATVIRESIPCAASQNGDEQALIQMIEQQDRFLTAPAMIPDGLCFAGVGYPDKIFLQ
eukprot:TRINITY_DN53631_c0_g1_i1.p3 TRINITY_DN53631_c0_g1~~TRINITY_DN53631_c0_g1_i1.p3  ORF type:complete len:188 (-),score=27.83 TRINITY_DN53631_c0_g1_i1:71-568(-)